MKHMDALEDYIDNSLSANNIIMLANKPKMNGILKFIKEKAEQGETEIHFCIPVSLNQALELKRMGFTVTEDTYTDMGSSSDSYTVHLNGYKQSKPKFFDFIFGDSRRLL